MNKIFNFTKRITNDTFMSEIESGSIRNEILSSLLESYKYRVKTNITQKEYAKLKDIPLATLKRIEFGTCTNLKFISRYCLK